MKNLIIIALLLISVMPSSFSSHVVGGDIHFTQTGSNTYDVVMRLYRDCNGISLPASQSLNIFDAITCASVPRITLTRVPGALPNGGTNIVFGDDCYTPSLCVEEHVYTGNVTLPNNPNGYRAQWSVCARNTTMNLNGSPCAGLYTIIPDPALAGGNTSPDFVDYPRDAYMCINIMKCLDFSATDADGDSLSYELITPIQGFTGCTSNPSPWASNHNLTNPLGPGSACTVDAVTGCVNARPARGGAYVLSVVCSEWRNGIKIGETVRDLQYFALNCRFNSPPVLADFELKSDYTFDEERCLDFYASDVNAQDTFFLEINSNAYQFGAVASIPQPNSSGVSTFNWNTPAGTTETDTARVTKLTSTRFEGVGAVGARFCWNVDNCDILSVDSFFIDVVGYSLGCDGSKDTVSKRVSVPVNKSNSNYVVPNVFSPNDDGVNDEFYLEQGAFDRCYDALNVRVYNRWGQIVFTSEDAQFRWDGNDEDGNKLSEGTYFVILQGYYGGKEVTQNFPVTLFR